MSDQNRESRRHKLIAPNERVVIVMIGLPARGKSYMAKKIYKYLIHLNIESKVFNLGSYRRLLTRNQTVGKTSASFFDPTNDKTRNIRKACCIAGMNDMLTYFNSGGYVGILDGTNSTLYRRQLIRQYFNDKSSNKFNIFILYIESICNDDSIIKNNIIKIKLNNPDYSGVNKDKAIKDFYKRIEMYQKHYKSVDKNEGSYIKIINVGTEVIGFKIDRYIELRIFYFLMHLHLSKKVLINPGNINGNTMHDNQPPGPKLLERRQSYLLWNTSEDTYKMDNNNESKSNGIHVKAKLPPVNTIPLTSPSPATNKRLVSPKTTQLLVKSQRNITKTNNISNAFAKLRNSFKSTPYIMKDNMDTDARPARPRVTRRGTLSKLLFQASLDESASDLKAIQHIKSKSIGSMTGSIKKKKGIRKIESLELMSKLKGFRCSIHDCDTIFDETSDGGMCKLCRRVICENHSSMVPSKKDPTKLFRICELCLYETDSDDDDKESSIEADILPPKQNSNDDGYVGSNKKYISKDVINHEITNILDNNDNMSKQDLIKKLNQLKSILQ